MSIVVLDYGRGNLRSAVKALESCGAEVRLTQSADEAARADKLVVPGVGAFGDCVSGLRRAGLDDVIASHIRSGKPFLGICIGLQVLFEESEESPGVKGLGILPGRVVRFAPTDSSLKVPHMGWNELNLVAKGHPLFRGIAEGAAAYFVHSYHALPSDPTLVAATAQYGIDFPAAIIRDNLVATQFHPEKSQGVGLRLLENFVEM